MNRLWRRFPWFGSAAFALLTFTVYICTLAPSIHGGDSGELVVVADQLGIAHPPGYPLYTLLAHIFTWVPFGETAWRVNLFSAFCAALAAGLVFELMRIWLGSTAVGLFSAGIFAFSFFVWRYAVVAEVFALNNLLCALMLYAFVRYYTGQNVKWAWVFAFSAGLGISNHHTSLLFSLPLTLVLFAQSFRSLLKPRVFVMGVGLFFCGLLPYLYLPLAASDLMPFSWGDPSDWDGFLNHFLRKDYGTFRLSADAGTQADLLHNLIGFVSSVAKDTKYYVLVLACGGLMFGFWQERLKGPMIGMVIALLSYLLIFNSLANIHLDTHINFEMQSRFWLQPMIIISLLAGYGFYQAIHIIPNNTKFYLWVFACLAVLIHLGGHWRQSSQKGTTLFRDLGKSVLEYLPPNTMLLMRNDIVVNAVRYWQFSKGFRTDVRALPLELLAAEWMGRSIKRHYPDVNLPDGVYAYADSNRGYTFSELLVENLSTRPVFATSIYSEEQKEMRTLFEKVHLGFVLQVVPAGEKPNLVEIKELSKGIHEFPVPPKATFEKSSEQAVANYYWSRQQARLDQILTRMGSRPPTPGWVIYSIEIMENIVRNHPKPKPEVFRNLGVSYQYISQDPEIKKRQREVWQKYVELGPADDPVVQTIKNYLEKSGMPAE